MRAPCACLCSSVRILADVENDVIQQFSPTSGHSVQLDVLWDGASLGLHENWIGRGEKCFWEEDYNKMIN